MIQWLHDEQCSVALDTRHQPALISTWYGQPSCRLVDHYFSWSDACAAAALADEQRMIHIINLLGVQVPAAIVRKRAIEHARENLAVELRVATIAVTESLAMRGFVGALFATGQYRHDSEVLVVESIDEAIEEGLRCLREARIPPPVGLAPGRYCAPTLDLAS
jgi:hypothetical protein